MKTKNNALVQAEWLLETLRHELNNQIDKKAAAESAWAFAKKRYTMQQQIVEALKERSWDESSNCRNR